MLILVEYRVTAASAATDTGLPKQILWTANETKGFGG